jgi:hypothetical protein
VQVSNVGDTWCQGFLNQYADLLTIIRTLKKDVKRRTWIREENFENPKKLVQDNGYVWQRH